MLAKIEIENFKAIEKLAMEFQSPLTVIVGPNGSGKTSILQAIDSFRFDAIPEPLRPKGTINPSHVRLTTSYGQTFDIPSESHATQPRRRIVRPEQADKSPPPPFGCVLLRFNSSSMANPSSDAGNPPPLNSDGSNLAAVLTSLCLSQPDKFDMINASLRSVIPEIRRIRIQQVDFDPLKIAGKSRKSDPVTLQSGHELLFDTERAQGITADLMSEGTLLALGIVTSMSLGDGQLAILLDDLDASLHPSAQAKLISTIRELQRERPDVQIIATSHSPYLLHSLDFDEVRLTTLRDDGTVACGRLMDHPDFDRWKDEMTPGEMWSLFGEKWIANPPAPEPAA